MRIDHLLYLNETSPDGGDPGAAVAEPAAEPAEPAEAAVAAEPTSTFDERWYRETAAEEADAIVQARLNALLEQVSEPNGQPQGQPGQYDWTQLDPFGDNYGQNLGQGIAETVQQAVAQALSPFQQSFASVQEQQQAERGEQAASDMIHDAISAGDEITDPGKQLVRPIAEMLSAETIGRYGNTPRAAEAAIYQAVDLIRQLERAAAERGVTQNQNHLTTLAGAATEPGVGATAGVVPGQPTRHMSTDELLNRHFTAA